LSSNVSLGDWRPSTDAELDRFAEITPADVDDAVQSLKERVPESAPLVDAARNDTGEFAND
jgi:hypothetical protein